MKTLTDKVEKLISMRDCKTAFAIPGDDSIIDLVHPVTGLSAYCNESLEQIRLRYPGAEIVNVDEFCAAKGKRQDGPITWTETTEAKYDEMLCVLPPAAMQNGGFLVGEPWDHHAVSGRARYQAFTCKSGKYFASGRPITKAEFLML